MSLKEKICIIDFGQSFIKFLIFDKNLKILFIKKYKNFFFYKKKKYKYYDVVSIQQFFLKTINKLEVKYKFQSISCISHGSTFFYLDKKQKIKSSYLYNSTNKSKYLDKQFNKIKPNFKICFTHLYKNFHNLGKGLFYFRNKISNFFTLPSFINWIFCNKNILDYTYFGCHTFLWNFKKKKVNFFFKNKFTKEKNNIKKPGILISRSSHNLQSKNIKIYNGMHDTSSSFNFHNKFFKNTLMISSGTTYVFGYMKNFNFLKQITKKFYLLLPINLNKIIIARNFSIKSFLSNKNNYNQKKLFNKILYEINHFIKMNLSIKAIVIDGPIVKEVNFLKKLKEKYTNIQIFIFTKEYAPALGIASTSLKMRIDNFKYFYKEIK